MTECQIGRAQPGSAAQGRRAVWPPASLHRAARATPRQRRPAAAPGPARPARRHRLPVVRGYATKAQPSTADMLAKLRRVLIAAKFRASRPDQPTL